MAKKWAQALLRTFANNILTLKKKVFEKWYKRVFFLLLCAWLMGATFITQRRYLPLDPTAPPQIFISQCEEDLRRVLLRALNRATHTIWLKIYACTDVILLKRLQERADEGLHVTVLHDLSSEQGGLEKLHAPLTRKGVVSKGLMHQKILLIDEAEAWIGSTNWTAESLCVHENILIGFYCPEFVETMKQGKMHRHFTVCGQRLEFWMLPYWGKEALAALTTHLNSARHHVRVAMFALSHPLLIDTLILLHRRGISVEVIVDFQMSQGVSKRAVDTLHAAGVPLRIYKGVGILHYKLAWIDNLLISGSTNWTQAAFKKNADCILTLYDLTPLQQRKLSRFWRVLHATSVPPLLTHLTQAE